MTDKSEKDKKEDQMNIANKVMEEDREVLKGLKKGIVDIVSQGQGTTRVFERPELKSVEFPLDFFRS